MSMVTKIVLVFLSFSGTICEVLAFLPSPQNLTLQTLNTQYILRWQWEQQSRANQNVTFNAQYLPKYMIRRKKQDWTSVCNATSDLHCDFTESRLHYQGLYVLRVRAECAEENSEWIQIEFFPDQDANLGPPSKVEVFPENGMLRVWISDPLMSNNKSMRETLMPSLYFLIQYWKQSQNVDGTRILKTANNEVALVDLQPWTVYCVRVRSNFDFYNKTSLFSPVLCRKTSGQIPVWVLILVGCPVLAGLLYGLYKSTPRIKSTFFPSAQLPNSMCPCDSSGTDWSRLLSAEMRAESFCEKLEVCSEVAPPEIVAPPAPPVHSHQSSRDSGVYSTGEGSGQQAGHSGPLDVTSEQIGAATVPVKLAERGVDSGLGRIGSAPAGDSMNALVLSAPPRTLRWFERGVVRPGPRRDDGSTSCLLLPPSKLTRARTALNPSAQSKTSNS
ncbi:hypothetical protein GJAV_G00207600 [Gymnothorax javanicus]|nr:hypothetical protein GJAV_G00207600 [Gymnothorax javanicus]